MTNQIDQLFYNIFEALKPIGTIVLFFFFFFPPKV